MAAVMVLGPSRWLDPGRKGNPLQDRRRIVARLRQRGIHAVVMEDEAQDANETHTAFFSRLIQDLPVQTYLVYWPFGARLHGLEKETGDLLRWLHEGTLEADCVYLLVESQNLNDADGCWALAEPGNRTRYHEDFLAYGVHIRVWDGQASLNAHLQGFALDTRAVAHKDGAKKSPGAT